MAILIFAVLFGIEFKKNRHLVKERRESLEEIGKADSSKKRLITLERELSLLHKELKFIDKKIPQDEKEPLEFLKRLSILGEAIGLRNLEFTYQKENSSPKSTETSSSSYTVSSSNTQPIYIEATFECEYPRLIYLLEKIYKLERLVIVERVSIERNKDILPRQKVNLRLIIYTFLNQTKR
jgi:hypothetical protein